MLVWLWWSSSRCLITGLLSPCRGQHDNTGSSPPAFPLISSFPSLCFLLFCPSAESSLLSLPLSLPPFVVYLYFCCYFSISPSSHFFTHSILIPHWCSHQASRHSSPQISISSPTCTSLLSSHRPLPSFQIIPPPPPCPLHAPPPLLGMPPLLESSPGAVNGGHSCTGSDYPSQGDCQPVRGLFRQVGIFQEGGEGRGEIS